MHRIHCHRVARSVAARVAALGWLTYAILWWVGDLRERRHIGLALILSWGAAIAVYVAVRVWLARTASPFSRKQLRSRRGHFAWPLVFVSLVGPVCLFLAYLQLFNPSRLGLDYDLSFAMEMLNSRPLALAIAAYGFAKWSDDWLSVWTTFPILIFLWFVFMIVGIPPFFGGVELIAQIGAATVAIIGLIAPIVR